MGALNWVAVFRIIVFIPSPFYFDLSKFKKLFFLIAQYLNNEFNSSIGSLKTPGLSHFIISIVFSNFIGLFPYTFTATSHLSITIALSLPIWLGYIIFSSLKNINFFLSHLVPLGTPYPLIPFMVLIEIIRRIIRPITLSVRLAANIIAGHLLIVLLRGQIRSIS